MSNWQLHFLRNISCLTPPLHIFLIINQLDIYLIDYRQYSPNKTDEAFYDNYHLTGYGAREYTRFFIESNSDLFD